MAETGAVALFPEGTIGDGAGAGRFHAGIRSRL